MKEPENLQAMIISVYQLTTASSQGDHAALEQVASTQYNCMEAAVHQLPRDLYIGLWHWMVDLNKLLETA